MDYSIKMKTIRLTKVIEYNIEVYSRTRIENGLSH